MRIFGAIITLCFSLLLPSNPVRSNPSSSPQPRPRPRPPSPTQHCQQSQRRLTLYNRVDRHSSANESQFCPGKTLKTQDPSHHLAPLARLFVLRQFESWGRNHTTKQSSTRLFSHRLSSSYGEALLPCPVDDIPLSWLFLFSFFARALSQRPIN